MIEAFLLGARWAFTVVGFLVAFAAGMVLAAIVVLLAWNVLGALRRIRVRIKR